MSATPLPPGPAAWAAAGRHLEAAGHRVFVADLAPEGAEVAEPLLVLHGFPTSSYDFHLVVGRLRRGRRVVLVDLLGFGLSAKPDLAYTMGLQADVVADVTAALRLDELSLLTHDMGDTVGGELLARQQEGAWPVQVRRRVLTNGSIYIEWAQLTAGQQLLLSLPDARLDPGLIDGAGFTAGIRGTFAPGAEVAGEETDDAWALASLSDGHLLLPRLVRYIEERRRAQDRFTGAIEAHPSPLAVVWGAEDPVAVAAMATRLQQAVPGSPLTMMEGVGHFPMLEAPGAFADAVEAGLAG